MRDDYPGWEYQELFDHMSEAHGLTLTKGEMDEIILKSEGVALLIQLNTIKDQQAEVTLNDMVADPDSPITT